MVSEILNYQRANDGENLKVQFVEIEAKAKLAGVNNGKLGKMELIRAIQKAELNRPCFQTNWEPCDQADCYCQFSTLYE